MVPMESSTPQPSAALNASAPKPSSVDLMASLVMSPFRPLSSAPRIESGPTQKTRLDETNASLSVEPSRASRACTRSPKRWSQPSMSIASQMIVPMSSAPSSTRGLSVFSALSGSARPTSRVKRPSAPNRLSWIRRGSRLPRNVPARPPASTVSALISVPVTAAKRVNTISYRPVRLSAGSAIGRFGVLKSYRRQYNGWAVRVPSHVAFQPGVRIFPVRRRPDFAAGGPQARFNRRLPGLRREPWSYALAPPRLARRGDSGVRSLLGVPGRVEPLPPVAFVPAFAKINLTLDVLGKQENGYHRLASVMQTIALHDTLALRLTDGDEVSCACDLPELETADNLAARAAHLARSTRAGWGDRDDAAGLAIELLKGVPVQAGLGGGSSDGATVLVALNRLWRLGHSRRRLEELSALLGSDLPFFVAGGTALIEGRGEVVKPLPDAEPLWLVLLKPPIPVPTGRVFQRLGPRDYTDATATRAVAAAIRQGEPVPLAALANALERGVLAEYPAVVAAWDALVAAGAPVVRLSGSGPTLFAPFRDLRPASQVYHRMREAGALCWLARTVTRDEVRRSRELARVDVRPLGGRHQRKSVWS